MSLFLRVTVFFANHQANNVFMKDEELVCALQGPAVTPRVAGW